ncbi:selenocysteine-specific translation elongation factor [Xanthobacter sp. 126]|uniref:selenocysteine-specific translation elongation factor n=1 Tax=Xanthobacter sp. 126 TaxID=1131814 RepID=UPI00045E713D|nr:selenocysteine-specific translation elongation factor [Xanthobacter sp. 126]
MILATSGHVDHGKSSLVKSLTGRDTMRLPEEKKRGLTIDLGFAYQTFADGEVIGYVDVPGHEKFIHNMVAGVMGIESVLLVVAADDGVMPQTSEHLVILELLEVRSLTVAVTKIDAVSSERAAEVSLQVGELLSSKGYGDVGIFCVSSLTGQGIEALKRHLVDLAKKRRPIDAEHNFRMPIDRCFTLSGVGIIVTGTAIAGSVQVGDRLTISPSGISVRVRSIRAQNESADLGLAGERLGINIVGVGLKLADVLGRGQTLTAPAAHVSTNRFHAKVRLLGTEARPLRSRSKVHLHIGTADVVAKVVPLERDAMLPGTASLVQIDCEREIAPLWGDKFLLRDASASRTIGGGSVIDPLPAMEGRRAPGLLNALRAMELKDPSRAIRALADEKMDGVDVGAFERDRNLQTMASQAIRELPLKWVEADDCLVALSARNWDELCDRAVRGLEAFHMKYPDQPGLSEHQLRKKIAMDFDRSVFSASVRSMVRMGLFQLRGTYLQLHHYEARLDVKEEAAWDKISRILDVDTNCPPRVVEIASELEMPPDSIRNLLVRVSKCGFVIPVADNRFFLPKTMQRVSDIRDDLAMRRELSVIAFKEAAGIGRNLAVVLLEYWDRVGVTRRRGNYRMIIR